MSYSYPLAKAALNDILNITEVMWDVQRNDELSGSGDARVWQAELAPPLWTAEIKLAPGNNNEVKQIAAVVRKLYGAQESFYLCDPLSLYPQSDPAGATLGASTVQVHTVGTGKKSLRLKGLPAGYVLTIGDKLQITYATSHNYFGEVSETVTADGSGVTPEFEVFPHVPAAMLANDAVTLAKPACQMFIMPGSFTPGTGRAVITEGIGFRAMERRR